MIHGYLQMKFILNKIFILPGSVLFAMILLCCGSQDKSGFEFESEESQQHNIDSLIRNIPPYEDIVSPLKEAEIHFQPQLLNLESVRIPEKQSLMALQTGVLMSDMVYCRYFEQVHKAMFLSSQIEDRMQALNIPTNKIQQVSIELETHMYSRDTVIDILSGAYADLNDGLIKSKRTAIFSLLTTGAWIESSRLMLADETVSDELMIEHWNKYLNVLSSLIPMIDAFESGIPENLSDTLQEIAGISDRNKALEKIEALYLQIFETQV